MPIIIPLEQLSLFLWNPYIELVLIINNIEYNNDKKKNIIEQLIQTILIILNIWKNESDKTWNSFIPKILTKKTISLLKIL